MKTPPNWTERTLKMTNFFAFSPIKENKESESDWYLTPSEPFLARLFEEKKLSYCRHSGVSVWVG
jgi:hypothetical protein